jgi:hypothetical protein
MFKIIRQLNQPDNKSIDIPANFNGKLYTSLIKNPNINTITIAYAHFMKFCLPNNMIYKAYYRHIYNIPSQFDEENYITYLYGKIDNIEFNKFNKFNKYEDLYKFYNISGKINYPLDESYYSNLYNITDTRFNWNVYLNTYIEEFGKKEQTIENVYLHYASRQYKKISETNDPYYKKLYNLSNDFNIQSYYNHNKSAFIFKEDYYYILDIYSNKILLRDIYNEIINKTATEKEAKFIENYDFLQQFSEITTEKDKRYYIHLKEFINDYYNFKKYDEDIKIIEDINIVSSVKQISETKKIKNKKISPEIEIQIQRIKNKIVLFKKFSKGNDISSVLTELNNEIEELEYINVIEIKHIDVETKIKTQRYERYYDSLYYNLNYNNITDVFNDITTFSIKLYNIYSLKQYTESITNYDVEKTSTKNAIYFVFNDYVHIPIVFRNNVVKLGKGWMHTVVCCLINETTVRTMCKKMNENINIIVLPYNRITFNEWNNTLLSKTFWTSIGGEYLILYNENIIILENHKINKLLELNYMDGYHLPHLNFDNLSVTECSEFYIMKKSFILETLDIIINSVQNCFLYKEIQNYYYLDKIPQDILLSFYVLNIKNNLFDFEKSFDIISYKYKNILTNN